MLTYRNARWLLVTGSLLIAGLCAQKADPMRLVFREDESSVTVNGQLRRREQAEYAVRARKGKTLTAQLTGSPHGSLSLKVLDSEAHELASKAGGSGRLTVVAPNDGDYEIWVIREKSDSPASTYKLKVSIR